MPDGRFRIRLELMGYAAGQAKNSFVLAIDEAGALGYADHDEQKPGEFGLAGGVLYPKSEEQRIQRMVERAAFKAKPGEKLHITAMEPSEQERLRQFLEDLVTAESLWLFYSAVSVAGYYQEHLRRGELAAKANASRRSKVKIAGAKRTDPDRLLEDVYRNIVFDAVAWCNDEFKGDYHLTVRSDRTDEGILADLEHTVTSLLQLEHNETTKVTGFDPGTEKVVEGSVSAGWKLPESYEINCTRENLSVDVNPLTRELALLPDTSVNWILYLLSNRVSENPNAALNDKAALKGFPLAERIYRFTREVQPHLADTLLGRRRR